MEIIKLGRERLKDFQSMLVDFFRELRGNQGWSMHRETEYMEDARRFFERGDIIFLALEEGRAVGFIRVSSREGSFWVEEIYVKPEMRGKGIGKKLVKRAEEEVSKHDPSLYLYILPQDRNAIGFWKGMGYDTINTIELVKDLRPTFRSRRTRIIEFLGERFRLFEWEREEMDEEERRFSELLEEFYRKGGSRREFVKLVNRALEEWLSGRK